MKRRFGWGGIAITGGLLVFSVTSIAWASSTATVSSNSDYIAKVEINYFGPPWGPIRCAVIYRDADGSIVDWRWCTAQNIPVRLADGRYVAVWDDAGVPRTVITPEVTEVDSFEDRELAERAVLPEEKRRKLSPAPAVSVTPAPAFVVPAAPVPPPLP